MNYFRLTKIDQGDAQRMQGILSDINLLLPQLKDNTYLSLEELQTIVRDPNHYLFVAHKDDKIVGIGSLIVLHTTTGKKARIEDVVVDKAYRGKGIGKQLGLELINQAKYLGIQSIHLTSRSDRKAANALYQKLGFRPKKTNVYKLDLR